MGAWAVGYFDNDTACDWALDLQDSFDLSLIEQTLNAALKVAYIDADLGHETLAAVETLTRVLGRGGPSTEQTRGVDEWVAEHRQKVPKPLRGHARAALDRVRGKESELAEMSNESGQRKDWLAGLDDLRKRLG